MGKIVKKEVNNEQDENGENCFAFFWSQTKAIPKDLKKIAYNIVHIRDAEEMSSASMWRMLGLSLTCFLLGWFVSIYISAVGGALIWFSAVSEAVARERVKRERNDSNDKNFLLNCDGHEANGDSSDNDGDHHKCNCGPECENRKNGTCCRRPRREQIELEINAETGKLVCKPEKSAFGASLLVLLKRESRDIGNQIVCTANTVVDNLAQAMFGGMNQSQNTFVFATARQEGGGIYGCDGGGIYG
ncbi:MAG: hypothetical protein P1P90_04285 [Patescibacteria group bacterium]|nr:hypothetical protein [Patescibacteria group bacterium]